MSTDGLEVFRYLTAVAAAVAAGINAYVVYQVRKLRRSRGIHKGAMVYPVFAAATCLAIFFGRSFGLLVGEVGFQSTDVFSPILIVMALVAGWTTTDRLDGHDDQNGFDTSVQTLHDLAEPPEEENG